MSFLSDLLLALWVLLFVFQWTFVLILVILSCVLILLHIDLQYFRTLISGCGLIYAALCCLLWNIFNIFKQFQSFSWCCHMVVHSLSCISVKQLSPVTDFHYLFLEKKYPVFKHRMVFVELVFFWKNSLWEETFMKSVYISFLTTRYFVTVCNLAEYTRYGLFKG